MSLITWTKEQFATNVDTHDKEHQAIFDGLNALHAAVQGGDRAQTRAKLEQLLSTVQAHFLSEEENFGKCGYANSAAHKVEHDKLIATCTGLYAKFQSGQAEITTETTQFLKDWLVKHIPHVDRTYSEPMLNAGLR